MLLQSPGAKVARPPGKMDILLLSSTNWTIILGSRELVTSSTRYWVMSLILEYHSVHPAAGYSLLHPRLISKGFELFLVY